MEKSTDATEEQSEEAAAEATQEVAKSAAFGDWAEISLVTGSIERLSWTLENHVWGILDMSDKTPAEKLSAISDALDDYKVLTMKVTSALIEDGNTEEVRRAAEAFKANTPEAVAKSLTETDAKVEELTKSLSDTKLELETVQKSLAEKTEDLATTTKELEKVSTRKTLVFGRGYELGESETTEKSAEPSIGELYLQKIGALPEAAK